MPKRPYTVAVIIPTGIGASIGGYAGDALPVLRSIASVADCVITHPNVMNGASMYWNLPNVLYVEGYGLDQFAAGKWGLDPVHQNRIGILFDRAIEQDLLLRHLQVADAARATLGLDIMDYCVTDQNVGVEMRSLDSGATWGTIANPDTLLRGAEKLIRAGADAIAVVVRFLDEPDQTLLQAYRQGQGVDPLAGAEAVISHLLVRAFRLPCAHAPALAPLALDASISPRSAAEELGHTFLPCVLAGLSRAPQFRMQMPEGQTSGIQTSGIQTSGIQTSGIQTSGIQTSGIWSSQVDALVVPESACGGSATLSLGHGGTKIITVAENQTRMRVYPGEIGLKPWSVRSYAEAIGVLAAHRAGVNPQSLQTGEVLQIKPLL
jgi:hypothetical protein